MFPQGFIDYMLARVDSIDKLAALIREVDGNHDKGAGELAEALVDRGVSFAEGKAEAAYAAAHGCSVADLDRAADAHGIAAVREALR